MRIIVAPGHGLGNATVGVYDSGATSPYGEEAKIVADIAARLLERCATSTPSVIVVPECGTACIQKHPRDGIVPLSHLNYTVHWINDVATPFDFVLSLHMNDGGETSTGVEVYYANGAPYERMKQAFAVADAVARTLDLPNRGAFPSNHSQHTHLAILDKTIPPALLIELGFISNHLDVDKVRDRGEAAVIAAIDAISAAQ